MSVNYNNKTSSKNALSKEEKDLIEQLEKVKQSDAKSNTEPEDKNGKTLHLKEHFIVNNSADFS